MKNQYILALDQGTTSSRAILFNHEGRACEIAQEEYTQSFPQAGWVEQDPQVILSSQMRVMQAVLKEVSVSDVLALGITNQRETVIVWERDSGQPIYPAVSWQDRRTAEYCQKLKEEGIEKMVKAKTGLRLDPYFSGTKLSWILDNISGARERAEKGELCFGTVDTWLLWNLSAKKVFATDSSNASRTLLYNIHEERWDTQLLALFRIPLSMLPEVRETSDDYDETSEGIPIRALVGDQQAALFGQSCFQAGMAKNTYGTGCFLLMQTGTVAVRSQYNLLTTIAWKINGEVSYALEGSVFTAGSALIWLRDGFGIISEAMECEELALQAADNGGLTFVPAFSGLGAPYWSDEVRGAFLGMTAGIDKRHVCRATIEAIALQCHDLVECMEADSGIELRELRVDGGLTQSSLLMEIQANLLQRPIVKPSEHEVTALGAAYLAGLHVGFWQSQDEISQAWQVKQRIESSEAKNEKLVSQWKRAIEKLVD